MQIPAGPNQIAQAYQGNPAALQANIQKDQQQKPNIMPDFAKLLALGTVTSEKDNAAKAQALQQLQGLMAQSQMGKPPTVFEQVQRKAAQMRMGLGQVAQPQPEPQGLPAALQEQGEPAQGIDQLPADFEFAGGGIVAFQSGEEVPDALESIKKQGIDRLRPLADKYKQEEAQFLAAAQSGDQQATKLYMDAKEATRQDLESQVGKQFGNAAPSVLQTLFAPTASAKTPDATSTSAPAPAVATPSKPAGGLAESPLVKTSAPATPTAQAPTPKSPTITDQEYQNALKILQSPTNKASYAKEINSRTDLTPEAKKSMIERFDNGWAQWEKVKTQWEAENSPQPKPPAPKPAAPAAPKPAAPKPAQQQQQTAEPVDPMEAALSKSIISYLGQKPEDVYKEGVERNRATVGLDALLQEKERRIAATEALLQKQQTGRLPLWVTQLQEFSRANPRAGLGAQLGLSGAGAEKARAEYEAEDRAFNAEINKLRDSVLQARIEGRYKDAAFGEAAIKDLTANRRQAETSGTSLLNTQATIKSTAESKRQHEENKRIGAADRAAENKRQFDLKLEQDKNKHRDRMENFIKEQERKQDAFTRSSPEYKKLVEREMSLQNLLISSNQKVRENAEAELQRISEKKAELLAKNASGANAEAPKTTKPAPNATPKAPEGYTFKGYSTDGKAVYVDSKGNQFVQG